MWSIIVNPTTVSIIYYITACSIHSEILGHVVICLHRYLVLRNINSKMEDNFKKTFLFNMLIIFVPLLCNFYRVFYKAYLWDEDGVFVVRYEDTVIQLIYTITDLSLCTITMLPQLIFALLSFLIFRKVVAVRTISQNESHELALFGKFLLLFSIQKKREWTFRIEIRCQRSLIIRLIN